jgi:hypothetical protein
MSGQKPSHNEQTQGYMEEFVFDVERHLLQSRQQHLPAGRKAFFAENKERRYWWQTRAIISLRMCVALRNSPELIPRAFRADAEEPIVLYLIHDLLPRLIPALDVFDLPLASSRRGDLLDFEMQGLLQALIYVAEDRQRKEFYH